jgi:hypothetical protein
MNYQHKHHGFVALMSAVVISAILLGLMASVGLASFYARFDALGIENKRESAALAESCINVALLALATSSDPAHYSVTNQPIVIDNNRNGNMTCVIKDVIHNGANVTIDAYAATDNSFGNVSVTASLSPKIQLISWNQPH